MLRAGRSGDRGPVGGEIFRTYPNQPWGAPSHLYNRYPVFPGGKAAGGGVDHLSTFSADIKERVEQ